MEKTGQHGGQPHGDAGHPAPPRDWGKPQGASGALPPNLPQGQPLPNGLASTDAISQTLAAIPPNQLLDILGQMRVSRPKKMVHQARCSGYLLSVVRNDLPRASQEPSHFISTTRLCALPGYAHDEHRRSSGLTGEIS